MGKKLYFYYSAMNAGKSTTLLQSSYNYNERGIPTICFCPAFDNRFEKSYIHSRIGLKEKAVTFDENFDFFSFASKHEKLGCILIDEAHFMKKAQVEQLTAITTKLDIPVLAYGLRSDFLGEPFEGSTYLLAWAQELIEIKTICHCGSKATMNLRIDENGEPVTKGNQVQIGGNESYTSICLKHFKESLALERV